jgi:SAM-dependent methyltransferase
MFQEHKILWDDEKVTRLWDHYSRTPPYSGIYFSRLHGAEILRHSGLAGSSSAEVLDFGCGTGYMWDHIVQNAPGWRYTGLDFSPASVQALQSRAGGHPKFARAVHTSSLPSPFGDDFFDIVILVEVVEHLADGHLDATFREALRVLKPGGVLLITTPDSEDLTSSTKFCPDCGCVFHEWQHVRSWTSASLTETLQGYGFELERSKSAVFGSRFHKFAVAARRLLSRGVGRGPRTLIALYRKR